MKRGFPLYALAGFLAAMAAKADDPGATAHLVEARAADSAVYVFLPVQDILSGEDATNYLLWAEATYPGRQVKAVWETDAVALPVSDPSLLPLLREGDKAVDPSGRNRFAVEKVGEGGVSLRLDRQLGRNEADPHLCLTNAWILSRNALAARWKSLLGSDAAKARREMDLLMKSVAAKKGGAPDGEWRAMVERLVGENPQARAGIELRNGTGTGVWVRVEGETKRIESGKSWLWRPDASRQENPVRWEARGCGSKAHHDDLDEDWNWGGGVVEWTPLGEDVVVDLKAGGIGKPRTEPVVMLPKDAVPFDGTNSTLAARIVYARPGSAAEFARDVTLQYVSEGAGGKEYRTWMVKVLPRLAVKRCEVSPEGWEPASYAPSTEDARPLSRDEKIVLGGAPMKRKPKPWGTLRVALVRSGCEGGVRLEVNSYRGEIPAGRDELVVPLGQAGLSANDADRVFLVVSVFPGGGYLPAVTNVVATRGTETAFVRIPLSKPAPPWPSEQEVSSARNWLKNKILGEPEKKKVAAEKYWLMGFRPSGPPSPELERFEPVVVSMTKHIRECPGCGRHEREPLQARAEALRVLGWDRDSQKEFSAWPSGMIYNKEDRIRGTFASWWRDCEGALSRDWERDECLQKALPVWNGAPGSEDFARAFIHVENCHQPDCAPCGAFRAFKEETGKADFHARREAFFRALMLNTNIEWKAVSRPDEDNIRRILGRFSQFQEKGGKP